MKKYMNLAVEEAYKGINNGHGGPFGCVIVKDDKVIGQGHNRVLANNDCTCHGEMEAIRDACKNTGSFDLSGAELYTTAEPCPMCLGAILWANIKKVYYGCDRHDTDGIGFRDNIFYEFLDGNTDILSVEQTEDAGCRQLFDDYVSDKGNRRY